MDWSVLITPVASFFGAGLAARLAVKSFYKEKVWERKAEAYTVIFGALSELNYWFDTHQDAYESDRELSSEDKEQLWASYKDAQTDLRKRLGREVWLLPDECRLRIDKMSSVLNDRDWPDWFRMLDTNNYETAQAIADLRKMVRRDLELEKPATFANFAGRIAKFLRPSNKLEGTIP